MTTTLASKTDSPSPTFQFPRPPHSLELTVLFREFIHYWTGLKTTIPEMNPSTSLADPIEFATRWNGSVQGTLVLRASGTFLEKLVRIFAEKGGPTANGKSLFQEMVTLYSIFLVHYVCLDELFELGPILARASRPSQWPSVEPHVLCAVEVGGEPVEIRLWIGSGMGLEAGKKGAS